MKILSKQLGKRKTMGSPGRKSCLWVWLNVKAIYPIWWENTQNDHSRPQRSPITRNITSATAMPFAHCTYSVPPTRSHGRNATAHGWQDNSTALLAVMVAGTYQLLFLHAAPSCPHHLRARQRHFHLAGATRTLIYMKCHKNNPIEQALGQRRSWGPAEGDVQPKRLSP